MKLKKIITVLFLVTTLILSITNYTNAAEGHSMEMSLKFDKNENKIGDEILIDVYINQIKDFSGINTFTAKKVYDTECLEYLGTNPMPGWEVVGDATNVVIRKMEGENIKKGKLCTLKFKVLKDINTTVQLTEVDACGDDGDVYYEDGNVNSPSVEITFSEVSQNSNVEKSYTGIVLISVGVLGLIGVGTHYILNKNKR